MRVVRIACACIVWLGMLMSQSVNALESGDTTIIQLQDWTIRDGANNRTLQLTSTYAGWLEPGKHIVASRTGIVPSATFTIVGWDSPGAGLVMTSLQIVQSGYRTLDANLSSKTDDRDKMMTRSYNTDSYSIAGAPFVQNYRLPPQPALFDDGLYAPPTAPHLKIIELYPYSSDCSPFDSSVLCGDYIKLYNPTDMPVDLADLVVRTDSSSSNRTSSNTFTLAGQLLPGEYYTLWQTDTGSRISLTNSGGYVWLEDTYGIIRYQSALVRYESAGTAQQGYAYAEDALGSWQWTTTPMPGLANKITLSGAAGCEEGKYRNPDTGRCRSLEETINALATCEEGYERNPTTNRCRKLVTVVSASPTPCKEGQERNPETNRCRSIAATVAALLPCDEGYERNPATNRCRKVKGGEVLAANYPVQKYDQTKSASMTGWIIGGVGAVALGYGVWEWRREIAAGLNRLGSAFTSGK